jgi:hypothetical protein
MSAQILPKLTVFATAFCLILIISSCARSPKKPDSSVKTLSYNDYPAIWDDANIQELIAWLKANNSIMDKK